MLSGLPDDLALVVGTSGSTGTPKRAMLTAGNLRSSIGATAARLGGHGQWLLTVPGHHVAGLQVLLRSVVAGTTPHVMDLSGGFTPGHLVGGRRRDARDRPAHLRLARADPADPAPRRRRGDASVSPASTAVLVGGAATHPDLLARAADAGVTAVTTYGMSETAGGCVYDGRPLDGTASSSTATGASTSSAPPSPTATSATPSRTRAAFPAPRATLPHRRRRAPRRRAAACTSTGASTTSSTRAGSRSRRGVVEEAVARLDGIAEAVAVGIPDPEWGEALAVAVVRDPSLRRPPDDRERAARAAARHTARACPAPSGPGAGRDPRAGSRQARPGGHPAAVRDRGRMRHVLRFLPFLIALALSIYCVVDCIQSDEQRGPGPAQAHLGLRHPALPVRRVRRVALRRPAQGEPAAAASPDAARAR